MADSTGHTWGGISAKLIALFIAAQLLTLTGAGFGFRSALQSLDALDATSKVAQERSTNLDINAVFKEQVQEWKNVLLRGKDPAMLDRYWQQFLKREEEVRKTAAALKSSTGDRETVALLDRFLADHEKAGARYREGLKAFRAAGFDHQKGDTAVRGVDRAPAKLLDEAMDRLRGESTEQIATTQAKFRKDLRTATWVMLGCVLLGALLVIWIVRTSVRHPLRRAVDMAMAIGRRDLTQKASARSADEVGQLLRSFDTMSDGLIASMQEISAAAINVQTGAKEIERGNTDLSARTEEHASSLEETAASMEEMAAGVKQTAERTQQASQLSKKAEEVATKGQAVFGLTVESMKAISSGAERIGEITSVIDSIAFQTNILALNAAVEAARAGEQGKGFAVVAAEVRALAQRSAGAAKEIKALIGSARTESESGTRHVADAMRSIDQIVASIRDVSLIIDDISITAREQAGGVDQVTRAITQMETVTQQNAALVEEAAAAAESMRSQAEALLQLVSTYRLPNSAGATPVASHGDPFQGPDRKTHGPTLRGNLSPRLSSARPAIVRSPVPSLIGAGSRT